MEAASAETAGTGIHMAPAAVAGTEEMAEPEVHNLAAAVETTVGMAVLDIVMAAPVAAAVDFSVTAETAEHLAAVVAGL